MRTKADDISAFLEKKMLLGKQFRILFLFLFIGLGGWAYASAAGDQEKTAADHAENAQNQGAEPRQSFFDFGYDQRFRNEDWNNIQDQNNQSFDVKQWSIFRQRFWFRVRPGTPNIEMYVRLLNQFAKTSTPDIPLNLDEIIFDNLYVDFKKTFIPGLSIKVGRQDMMFGEGFILMDGSADEGPRTSYFNAIDISYVHRKSKLDLIGIHNPRLDRFLPVIRDRHKSLNPSDEQAVGLYYTDRNHEGTDFDAYYFLKKEIHDWRPTTGAQFQPDRHVNTFGGRVVHRLGHGFTATSEFALQRGWQHPRTRIQAWGGYGYLKKEFSAKWNPYVLGGYWALSGDDPSTPDRVEGWDPLFERWPKWSGLYPWSLVPEKGISYWTNMKMAQAEAGFTPWKPLQLKGVLYHVDAFHRYAPGDPGIFAEGTHRGEILEMLAFYHFSDCVAGEFRYEILAPGNFYRGNTTGQFFRFEINYSWKHAVKR